MDQDIHISGTTWMSKNLQHYITSLVVSPRFDYVVSASEQGFLICWKVDGDQIRTFWLMLGSKSKINCLAWIDGRNEEGYVISSSDTGEICRWNVNSASCVMNVQHSFVSTNFLVHKMNTTFETLVFAYGCYPEIFLLEPLSLKVVASLQSRVAADWITASFALNALNKVDDVVVALSASGVVKLWSFVHKDLRENDVIYESESKQLKCANVQQIKYCQYNPAIVLIVCAEKWQVYYAADFTLLCSQPAKSKQQLIGGDFLLIDKVCIYSSSGEAFVFHLPFNSLKQLTDERTDAVPLLVAVLCPDENEAGGFLRDPLLAYQKDGQDNHIVLRGDSSGTLVVWRFSDVEYSNFMEYDSPIVMKPFASGCLESRHKVPIFKDLSRNSEPSSTLHVFEQDRLVVGFENGLILILSTIEAAAATILLEDMPIESCDILKLSSHTDKITCLLHPHTRFARYDPSWLVSGAKDFSVVLWDLFSGASLYKFHCHGGPVQQILLPPDGFGSLRFHTCVCSIAGDNSVALLSLRERKKLLLASQHAYSVSHIIWHSQQDQILVVCEDCSLHVWQVETGHMDRVLYGTQVEAALDAFGFSKDDLTSSKNQDIFLNSSVTVQSSSRVSFVFDPFQVGPGSINYLVHFDIRAMLHALCDYDIAHNDSHLSLQKEFAEIISIGKERLQTTTSTLPTPSPRLRPRSPIPPPRPKSPVMRKPLGTPIKIQQRKHLLKFPAHLILSCLHCWNLDPSIDQMCKSALLLSKPNSSLTWAIQSRPSFLSFLMPNWQKCFQGHGNLLVNVSDSTDNLNRYSVSSIMNTWHIIALLAVTKCVRKQYSLSGDHDLVEKLSKLEQLYSHINEYLTDFKPPRLDMYALKWLEPCLFLREVIQDYFVFQLHKLGPAGRQAILSKHYPMLKRFSDETYSPPRTNERTDQTQRVLAIVFVGVIGAEFGQELQPSKLRVSPQRGFGINEDMAMETSKLLMRLLQASRHDSSDSLLRRLSIDLFGRGFAVWEPYLDSSAIIMRLFEIAAQSSAVLSTVTPTVRMVSPSLDLYLVTRYSLARIAVNFSETFIITLAKEVARFNSLAGSAANPQNSIMIKASTEIVHLLRYLINYSPKCVVERIVQFSDILLHCFDVNIIRRKGLSSLFSAIERLPMVSYCNYTKRLAVGMSNGYLALYDMKTPIRAQNLPAHDHQISAVAFSSEGKFIASYSPSSNQLVFWQLNAPSLFNVGNQSLKAVKVEEISSPLPNFSGNLLTMSKVWWTDPRTVVLQVSGMQQMIFKV